jgi:hypothetical protein
MRGIFKVMLLTTAICLVAGASNAQQDKPSPAEIKKHETSPGGKYQPSLDVLKEQTMEAPGARAGVPQLSQDEFRAIPRRSSTSSPPVTPSTSPAFPPRAAIFT